MFRLLVTATLLAAAVSLVKSPAAEASARGCTGAPNGYVCVDVVGRPATCVISESSARSFTGSSRSATTAAA